MAVVVPLLPTGGRGAGRLKAQPHLSHSGDGGIRLLFYGATLVGAFNFFAALVVAFLGLRADFANSLTHSLSLSYLFSIKE